MDRSNFSATFDVVHVILDAFFQCISFLITTAFFAGYIGFSDWKRVISIFVIYLLVFLLSNRAANIYNKTLFFYYDRIIRRKTLSFINADISVLLIYYFCLVIKFDFRFLLGFMITSYLIMILEVLIFSNMIDRIINRKHVPRCVYVGSKKSYEKYRYFLNKTSILINEIGFVSYDDDDESIEYIGSISNLEEIIREYNIDQVFFMQKSNMDAAIIQRYIDLCVEMGITCRVVMDIYNKREASIFNTSIGTYSLLTYHTVCMNTWEAAFKRIFDIVFSVIGIMVTSPVMLITAIAIKLDSPGPVLFKQVRVGKNGRHFKIWKFRSMYVDAEEKKDDLIQLNEVADGMMFKLKDDPRITRVGRFIRKTSIDELPQFFNVLRGSMSFVGTRPPTLDEVEKYSASQWRRISIKPGITGMWQTCGRSTITDFNEVVEMDVDYIDNWSLWMDMKIIFKTVMEIFSQRGAY